MNLSTQHLEQPSQAYVAERAAAEARLGLRLRKFFMGGEPRVSECDAIIRENERLRAGVAEARIALAKAFGDEGDEAR